MFSIIIPVYNVEEYLTQCINSVINQNFSKLEIILVNDGSTDNSGLICDAYTLKHDNVSVIHKENSGVSDARNLGIEQAKGEYIWCLDSDDFMEKDIMHDVSEYLEKNDYDMVTCGHINHYNDGSKEVVSLPYGTTQKNNINRDEYLTKLYKSKHNYWAPWKNIYRMSIVEEHQIKFPSGITRTEDCDFFMEFVYSATKFAFLDIPVVGYRIERQGSITNNLSQKSLEDKLKISKKHYNIFNTKNDELSRNMRAFFSKEFSNGVYEITFLSSEYDKRHINDYVKNNSDILKDSEGFKYNIARIVWTILGYSKGSEFLQLINRKSWRR